MASDPDATARLRALANGLEGRGLVAAAYAVRDLLAETATLRAELIAQERVIDDYRKAKDVLATALHEAQEDRDTLRAQLAQAQQGLSDAAATRLHELADCCGEQDAEDIVALLREVAVLRGQLAQAEQERERAVFDRTALEEAGADLEAQLVQERAAWARMEHERDQLRLALCRYGRHTLGCASVNYYDGRCTCGREQWNEHLIQLGVYSSDGLEAPGAVRAAPTGAGERDAER